jgi:putative ABC transport system permease protein
MVLTLAGIAIGLAGSAALTRLMSAMLYDTGATDPGVFGASAVLFLVVALLASYLPARRATRIDPTEALRSER